MASVFRFRVPAAGAARHDHHPIPAGDDATQPAGRSLDAVSDMSRLGTNGRSLLT